MFAVTESEAEAIRHAYKAGGELAAVAELRRHFPGIADNENARFCVRDRRLDTAATPTSGPTTPSVLDQVIDATMARALHADACRDHAVVAWVVMRDAPGYPDQIIARLATKRLSPYVLLADTLAGVQEQLPPGLVRAERQPTDPPEVVEIWFA